MFLCDWCHKQSRCGRDQFMEAVSSGLCEKCGTRATCSDCHNYDFRAFVDRAEMPSV